MDPYVDKTTILSLLTMQIINQVMRCSLSTQIGLMIRIQLLNLESWLQMMTTSSLRSSLGYCISRLHLKSKRLKMDWSHWRSIEKKRIYMIWSSSIWTCQSWVGTKHARWFVLSPTTMRHVQSRVSLKSFKKANFSLMMKRSLRLPRF
jgi:hypothetical protein